MKPQFEFSLGSQTSWFGSLSPPVHRNPLQKEKLLLLKSGEATTEVLVATGVWPESDAADQLDVAESERNGPSRESTLNCTSHDECS
jgi:hypothetical protein